jgi:AraC family transcriptional regulator, regulatory protein of adaptative response / methylated-DNA-[protein]-cysteine methyltransferase
MKDYYAVKTTGVYCRRGCGSRPARPQNVVDFGSAAAAEQAGFRPCKRCKPDQPPLAERRAAVIVELCRLIEAADQPPALDELARVAGMSVFHTHRLFKQLTGVTPRAYAAAHRAKRVRRELDGGAAVTAAIYGAGYNSAARFYEQSTALLGMTPSSYRAGGAGEEIRYAAGTSSLGGLLVAATERGVCAILLGDDVRQLTRDLKRRFSRARIVAGDPGFEKVVSEAVAMIETPELPAKLPLDIRGTAFQQRVWQALRRVPAGRTVSYTELARAAGAPEAVRAVAGACAANPLAVAIPCHRVVRADGDLSGYRWGVERKRALLAREAAVRARGDEPPAPGRNARRSEAGRRR